jgi:hypothetical protein
MLASNDTHEISDVHVEQYLTGLLLNMSLASTYLYVQSRKVKTVLAQPALFQNINSSCNSRS